MLTMLRSCGGPGYLATLVAAVALACTTGALVTAVARRARVAGVLASVGLLMAGGVGLVGFGGTLLGRKATQEAVAASSLSKSNTALVRMQGFTEARDCSRLGLGLAALPFLLGASAAAVALFTAPGRSVGDDDPHRAVTERGESGERANVPLVLVGAACAFTGLLASGGLGAASVGGADYEPTVWALMSTSERVLGESPASRRAACQAFDDALGAAPPEQLRSVTDVPKAAELCVRDRIASLGATTDPGERGKGARDLERGKMLSATSPATREGLVRQLEALR